MSTSVLALCLHPMVPLKAENISRCDPQTKHVKNRILLSDLRPDWWRVETIEYSARYQVLYTKCNKINSTICFKMSFPIKSISGSNPSDHEPIQKRTSSRNIKFWFSPDLRQIIEYQAIFCSKRFRFFCNSVRNIKTKQTPKSDWKYLISPSRST